MPFGDHAPLKFRMTEDEEYIKQIGLIPYMLHIVRKVVRKKPLDVQHLASIGSIMQLVTVCQLAPGGCSHK